MDLCPFPVRRPPTRSRLAAYTCPQSTRTGFSYTSKHTGHVKRPSGSASAADPASCAPHSPSCRCSAILLPRNAAQQRPRRRSLARRGRGGGRVRAGAGRGRGRWRSGPLGAGIKECAPGWGGASGWVTPFWPLGREGGWKRTRKIWKMWKTVLKLGRFGTGFVLRFQFPK